MAPASCGDSKTGRARRLSTFHTFNRLEIAIDRFSEMAFEFGNAAAVGATGGEHRKFPAALSTSGATRPFQAHNSLPWEAVD
jgi:hypothetical protein